jgi:hypothetical protein
MWRNRPLFVIKWTIASIAGLFVFFFIFFQMKDVVNGPSIVIASPQNGETATTSLVHIKGSVKNATQIFLNGGQIYTDGNGQFDEELLLAKGYNILELSATDRFEHIKKKQLELIYK